MNKLAAPAMRQLLSFPWKYLSWQSHVRYFSIKEVMKKITVACGRMMPIQWDVVLERWAKELKNEQQNSMLLILFLR